MYGPGEYRQTIGTLDPGTYRVVVNYLSTDIGRYAEGPEGASAFLHDPEGFAADHGWQVSTPSGVSTDLISQETHEFTVVPEPATMLLLSFGVLSLLRRRKGK